MRLKLCLTSRRLKKIETVEHCNGLLEELVLTSFVLFLFVPMFLCKVVREASLLSLSLVVLNAITYDKL